MGCKHRDIIRITDEKPEYFCKLFGKEITEYKCRDCMMKIENKNSQINELFGQIFGEGFGV